MLKDKIIWQDEKMNLQIFLLILLIMILICVFIIGMDTNRFVIRTYELDSNKIKEDIKFVFVSDLHNKSYGRNNERLLRKIDEIAPDFIVCGGDMPTANPGNQCDVAIHFITSLAAKYKVIYANGNHEYRMRIYPEKYVGMHENYYSALKRAGIEPLINDSVMEQGVMFHGLELDKKYYKRLKKNYPSVEVIQESFDEKALSEDVYHVLLAHNPDYFAAYAKSGVDLVLSGHVHGGVARIPGLGGVISPSFRLFPKYDGGLFKQENCTMIVSRGLGVHTIPVRFLNPGEIVVVNLKKTNID